MVIINKNKAKVNGIISNLYNKNMQIYKKKNINVYQKFDFFIF